MSNELEKYSSDALRAEIERRNRKTWSQQLAKKWAMDLRSSTLTEAEAAELNTLIGIEIDKVTVKPILNTISPQEIADIENRDLGSHYPEATLCPCGSGKVIAKCPEEHK